MSKSKQSQQPPLIWHVMARGVRQSPIFLTDTDRLQFLEILEWAARTAAVEIFAYCLMDNHYHLLIEGAGENLSRCIQLLNSLYAREFNVRAGTSGHLFQSRFRAYEAKSKAWILQRANYIHLNPVAAGLCDDPKEYRWSSIGAYMGGHSDLNTVRPSGVLGLLGTTGDQQRRRYEEHLQSATARTLAVREVMGKILQEPRRGQDWTVEKVRLEVNESLRLLAQVEESIKGRTMARKRYRQIRALLTSHLSQAWSLASAHVVAVVLGTSEAMVHRYRRQGKREFSAETTLDPLIEEIRSRFFGLGGSCESSLSQSSA